MLKMSGQTFQIEDEDETREMDSSDYGSSDESEYGDVPTWRVNWLNLGANF